MESVSVIVDIQEIIVESKYVSMIVVDMERVSMDNVNAIKIGVDRYVRLKIVPLIVMKMGSVLKIDVFVNFLILVKIACKSFANFLVRMEESV